MRRRVINASMPSRLALKPALPVAMVFSMMAMDSICSVSAGDTRNVIHGAGLEFRHCEERSDEAIHSFFLWRDGLLRGACHRAHIRATRWLAMTIKSLLPGEY